MGRRITATHFPPVDYAMLKSELRRAYEALVFARVLTAERAPVPAGLLRARPAWDGLNSGSGFRALISLFLVLCFDISSPHASWHVYYPSPHDVICVGGDASMLSFL
jgi:hypothetical protein